VESNEGPGLFLKIADEVEISPVLVARVILEGYIKDTQEKELKQYSNDMNRNVETDMELSSSSSPLQNQAVMKAEINRLLRDSSLIQNKELAYEVYLVRLKTLCKFFLTS
jgi:hypothetical protein